MDITAMEKIQKLIRDYIDQARLMQMATSDKDKPWICNVYFASDEAMNLYWLSKPTSRHSNELRENKKVAGAIALPHAVTDTVRGIQFEGEAFELSKKTDTEVGVHLYAARYGLSAERVQSILENSDGHLCYKIVPSLFVLFDTLNFPDNPRQEYRPGP